MKIDELPVVYNNWKRGVEQAVKCVRLSDLPPKRDAKTDPPSNSQTVLV